ncbi:uncharacterized protein LOC131946813 [Physella acuta]|uniref:uncharacterized protein LOC131946813 n=1 Tax=Physella acuta TaxID=109671 RepID=UPI0027DCF7DA|nr:uncharacterized protein LOC131946813 [Physella acuta]
MTTPSELIRVPTITTPSDDDSEEEVTETKIIGVTETGVIRKRSFKRKLTKEEKSKRKFGADKQEYEKITQRIMSERFFTSAIEGLQERLKMLGLMHTDCLDMLGQWETTHKRRIYASRHKRDTDSAIATFIVSLILVCICWLLKRYIW